VDGNDKCVLEMRIQFEGIPYADTFSVEVRWLARRVNDNDIKIDVGVFVDFKKSSFLQGKIRSGTIEETTAVHKNLLQAVQLACSAASGVEIKEEAQSIELPEARSISKSTALSSVLEFIKPDNHVILVCAAILLFIITRFSRKVSPQVSLNNFSPADFVALASKIDNMQNELREMRVALDELLHVIRGLQNP
jgi:hypothetical protein